MTPEELARELGGILKVRADDIIQVMLQEVETSLTDVESDLVDIGVSAGITAAFEELKARGLIG